MIRRRGEASRGRPRPKEGMLMDGIPSLSVVVVVVVVVRDGTTQM
jgi:hypothetical protein